MIPVKEDVSKGAHIKSLEEYRKIYSRSLEDPEGFWKEQAQRIDWITPPEKIMQSDMHAAQFRWYDGGQLNACFNCVDRHVQKTPDKTAIIWAKNEPGDYEHITFAQLSEHVQRTANVLKSLGVGKGDRVCIYLPMIPELAYTMLACARIGAIHSIVFAGFSAEALNQRIVDADAKLVITADEGLRGAKTIPLKAITDDAVKNAACVEKVLVVRRTGNDVAVDGGRDVWLHEAAAKVSPECAPETMEAEDPLFILYTSGSTGKPKGLLHTTGGYMVYASLTHQHVFDIHDDTVYFCAADIGWITGHSYIVYGPLANGCTTVMFESIPTYPNPSRYWEVCRDLSCNVLYTSPTALRALMREGDDWVTKVPRDSLRVLGTVGEPINPEVWNWYHDVVGDERMPIVDTWWQTETGGILITPLPGATPMKPGSATLPFFGVEPILVDEQGKLLEGNGVNGLLCIARAWPGQARTIYGDHQRYKDTYYSRFPGRYFTGDGCRRDEDGYYWITGRVDDVVNVSGHRIGTAEVESALVAHAAVAEAAVVGFPHDIKGQGIYAYVVLRSDVEFEHGEIQASLKAEVRKQIGPIATPDHIRVTGGLPKTRSGKIMRRILRKIAHGQIDDLGDTSTLADPSVVDSLLKTE